MDPMDQDELQELFEDKYQSKLDMSFDEWLAKGPKNETEAFARCSEIDRELNKTYDDWFDSEGDKRDNLGEHREKLKAEYDLIEETFHLEANDREW